MRIAEVKNDSNSSIWDLIIAVVLSVKPPLLWMQMKRF